jgi:hypothetical protein
VLLTVQKEEEQRILPTSIFLNPLPIVKRIEAIYVRTYFVNKKQQIEKRSIIFHMIDILLLPDVVLCSKPLLEDWYLITSRLVFFVL